MSEVVRGFSTWSDNAELGLCWDAGSQDVFLLGAGFSIAVSSDFPTTDQLGNRAVTRLRERSVIDEGEARVPSGGFEPGQFETWLARLAEDQPYLSTAENFQNRALFVEVSRSISEVLNDCEERLDHAKPSWLYDLVSAWHARQAHVITLNYDTLIERNVANHLLADPIANEQVLSRHILDDLPAAPTDGRQLTGVGSRTFRLLKLHGSTSWYWVPNDTTGATIGRWDPPPGTSRSDPDAVSERRRLLPGRAPFIVPPTSTKTGFYDNPVTREIWTRAYEALRQADRVFLIGYSYPENDLSVSGLIVDAVTRQPDPPDVHIVDLEPASVQARLRASGIASTADRSDGDPVRAFVGGYVDEAAQRVVNHLRKWDLGPTPGAVCAGWGTMQDQYARGWIQNVRYDDESATVVLEAGAPGVATSTPTPMLLDKLLGLLSGARRIELDHDGGRLPMVAHRALPQRLGDGSVDSWQLELFPAGPPPRARIRSNVQNGLGPYMQGG